MNTWDDVLAIYGYSSNATRRVLNDAVATVRPARILEVGSFGGSTAAALCHGNEVEYIHCVDNGSEFGDANAALRETCSRFSLPATLHTHDFFNLPVDAFGGRTFNVYHYDGPHAEHQHAAELALALPHLEHEFVYIVDDYSWDSVRRGCNRGLDELHSKVRVRVHHEYRSFQTNDPDGYWNGLLVAWCEKC